MLFWYIATKNDPELIVSSSLRDTSSGTTIRKPNERNRDPNNYQTVFMLFLKKEDLERFIDHHQTLSPDQEIQSGELALLPLPPHPQIYYEVGLGWDEEGFLETQTWWKFLLDNRTRISRTRAEQLSGP